MFRKGGPAFADENMLQVYELARILIDQVTPPDRNARDASIPTGSPHPARCHRIQRAFIENLRGMRKAGTGLSCRLPSARRNLRRSADGAAREPIDALQPLCEGRAACGTAPQSIFKRHGPRVA
jgi:hypothetical protein